MLSVYPDVFYIFSFGESGRTNQVYFLIPITEFISEGRGVGYVTLWVYSCLQADKLRVEAFKILFWPREDLQQDIFDNASFSFI